jgi:hypothetical protein
MEEQERQRLIQTNNQMEKHLHEKLNRLEIEEEDRFTLLRKKDDENLAFEHYIQGDLDYTGINDQEIEE